MSRLAPLWIVLLIGFVGSAHGQQYELVQTFANPKGQVDGAGDAFGQAVEFVGDRIAVAAYEEDTGATNAGTVYVYDRDGSLHAAIHNPEPQPDGMFGLGIAAVGDDRIVVGSWTPHLSAGVQLFDIDGNLLHTYRSPTTVDGQFGVSVAGIGGKVLVGSSFDNSEGYRSGAVYMYDQAGNLLHSFYSPDPTSNGRFGRSMAVLSDDKFVVSAGGENHRPSEAGVAYLFDIEGNHLATFSNPDPHTDDFFGVGVGRAGDDIVVGAIQFGGAKTGGVAYLFDQEGALLKKFANPNPDALDFFGYSVTGTGSNVIVGAVQDDEAYLDAGAVYVFNHDGGLVQTILDPVTGPAGYGRVMARGSDLLVGSHFSGTGDRFTNPGAVYLYSNAPEPSSATLLAVAVVTCAVASRSFRPRPA